MLSGNYTLLTTRPPARTMSKQHPEFMKVLPHTTQAGQTLKARIYYVDATPTADFTIATFDARIGEVYTFQIGYPSTSYPSKALADRIEIYCGTYGSGIDVVTYYPKDYDAEIVTALYYANSLCGIDSLICEQQDQQTIQTVQSEKAELNADFRTNYRNQRQHLTINNVAIDAKKVTTGWLPGKEHLQALKDLFLHNYAWTYAAIGGTERFLAIDVDQQVDWPTDNAGLQGIEISYRLAIDVKANSRRI
jgi:hypothetical protein